MYDYDSTVIWSHPIKSKKSPDLFTGINACYQVLNDANITPIIHHLDNEISDGVIKKKASNIKLQLPTTTASSLLSILLVRGKITSPPAYTELIKSYLHICGVTISIKSTFKSTYLEIQE